MATPHECSVCIGLTDSMVDVRFESLVHIVAAAEVVGLAPEEKKQPAFMQALGRLAELGAVRPGSNWANYWRINQHDGPEVSLFSAPFKAYVSERQQEMVEVIVTRGWKVRHYVFDMIDSELLLKQSELPIRQGYHAADALSERTTFSIKPANHVAEMMPEPALSPIIRDRNTPPVIEATRAVNGATVIKRHTGTQYKNELIEDIQLHRGLVIRENVQLFLEDTQLFLSEALHQQSTVIVEPMSYR